ncbi:glycoside hydrolase family 43 protein, partial [Streptomyces sp. NPDC001215]
MATSRRRFLGLAAATPLAVTGALSLGAGTARAADSAYVMCYFTESTSLGDGTDYGLHLAVSQDGLEWTPLNQNNPVVTPTEGDLGLRDPFILRRQDGTFVVLATDLKGTDWTYVSQYIHVWFSTDLCTFTGYHRLKLHDMNTHAWAPEAFWDASRGTYAVIYSAVDDSGHNVIMVNHTTDFLTASEPQIFFDPGYDVIDGDMTVGVGGVNYLYFKKNETLVGARSTSLDPGSFTEFSTAVSHGGTEAPELVKSLTSTTWYLYGDTYTPNGVFYVWQSGDLSTGTWTALDQKTYTQPVNSKHCGIRAITSAEYSELLAHWGTPS